MARRTLLFWMVALTSALTPACAAQSPAAQPPLSSSILIGSSPAAGSTVAEPDNIELHFDPPVRLDEVTVSGAAGTMPMMLQPAGEQAHYSLPLSGIDSGTYTVSWRATAQGREHRGSFQFTVR